MLYHIHELEGIYGFDRDWKSYLEDKRFTYWDCVSYTEIKKLLGYSEYSDGGFSAEMVKAEKQRKVDEISDFCKKHGMNFDLKETVKRSEPYKNGNGQTVRDVRIEKEGVFVMPAELSQKLLHVICSRRFNDLSGRLGARWAMRSRGLSEEAEKLASSAASMICEDIKAYGKQKPESGEYLTKLIVNAGDFRYTEPSGEVSGIIFKNSGLAPLDEKDERELFASSVIKGVREEAKNMEGVLDVLFEEGEGHTFGGCEINALVMYCK